MKLIVGLGNPGKEYDNTRHNVGFMAIDKYCNENRLDFKKKFNGFYTTTKINNEDIIFLKPQLYMNLSGEVVRKFVDYFKINIDDILIIYDDMDFEIGTYKIKPDGSSGGHNGMKNIISNLNTEKLKRIRIGISKSENDTINYVLGKFSKKDLNIINEIFNEVSAVIVEFTNKNFGELMNKYN
jgi:PTH1 family peptidyl-tRNA hydrolase